MKHLFSGQYSHPDPDRQHAAAAGQSSMNLDEDYEYRPLSAGEFRLLLLHEAESLHDDLRCSLETLCLPSKTGQLPDGKEFTALSYVWGSNARVKFIELNGYRLSIGSNLASALRHLRLNRRPLRLWVDALCINQSDRSERADQVRHMQEIYGAAEETVIYLGDLENSNTHRSAWNYLERYSHWALDDDLERNFEIPRQREEQTDFRGDLYDVHASVLTREWFRRVWVLQEVVVSRNVSIQCGRRRVPWDDFVKCTALQDRRHDLYGESLRENDQFEDVSRMWRARVAYHLAKDTPQYLPEWHTHRIQADDLIVGADIVEMLYMARQREATDPRDKIFGLLGISNGFDWRASKTIDYELPATRVYVKFAVDHMKYNHDFRILSYLGRKRRRARPGNYDMNPNNRGAYPSDRPRALDLAPAMEGEEGILERDVEDDDLPSWVPNWSRNTLDPLSAPTGILQAVGGGSAPTFDNEDQQTRPGFASADHWRAWQNSSRGIQDGCLVVQGRILGIVHTMMSPTSMWQTNEANHASLRRTWKENTEYQDKPLESQTLTLWALQLNATMFSDGAIPTSNPDAIAASQVVEAGRADVEAILRGEPGIPDRKDDGPSFLDHLDFETCPPAPRSIEAYLVERANVQTPWSADGPPRPTVVRARSSVVDQRQLGLYRHWEPSDPVPGSETADEQENSLRSMEPDELVLLPEEARFGDLVVLFPGAEVPFLLRREADKRQGAMDDASATSRLMSVMLPHAGLAQWYMDCNFVGECWVNGFEELVTDDEVCDTVFMVN